MKRLTLLIATAALHGVALAAPSVTFQGAVSTQTCEVTINSETNGIVLLPTVSVADFDGAGSTAGQTPFTITISDCVAPSATNLNVINVFSGYNGNVTDAGNLANGATTNPAGDVGVQLTFHGDAWGGPIVLHSYPIRVRGLLVLPVGQTSASHQMGARYITEGGNPTAGAVTAVLEYSITYQ